MHFPWRIISSRLLLRCYLNFQYFMFTSVWIIILWARTLLFSYWWAWALAPEPGEPSGGSNTAILKFSGSWYEKMKRRCKSLRGNRYWLSQVKLWASRLQHCPKRVWSLEPGRDTGVSDGKLTSRVTSYRSIMGSAIKTGRKRERAVYTDKLSDIANVSEFKKYKACWETTLSLPDFETMLRQQGHKKSTFCRWFESVRGKPPVNRGMTNNYSVFLSQTLLDTILVFYITPAPNLPWLHPETD